MARLKSEKIGKGVPQKHLHARVSYLHQVAQYLSSSSVETAGPRLGSSRMTTTEPNASSTAATSCSQLKRSQSRYVLSQLRGVSLKGQIRLSPALKHSICKRCDMLLISGSTCSQAIINESSGGKKPWADVLVMNCLWCGTEKKFPVGQDRIHRERGVQGPLNARIEKTSKLETVHEDQTVVST